MSRLPGTTLQFLLRSSPRPGDYAIHLDVSFT